MESQPEQNIDNLLNNLKSEYKKQNSSQSQSKMATNNESQADDYLNSIKAQYKNKAATQPSSIDKIESKLNSSTNKTNSDEKATQKNSQDLDCFDSIKAQYQNKSASHKHSKQSPQNISQSNDYLDDVKARYQHQPSKQDFQIDSIKSELIKNREKSVNRNSQTHSLDSIKESYQSKQQWQKSQEKLNYSRNKEEIIIQEQQKQLKKKQLTRQAEKWLAKLDPYSEEGMWFNQLAESYPSKLEAAMSYLSTLNQSDL